MVRFHETQTQCLPNEFSLGGIEFESHGSAPCLNFMDAVDEFIFSRGAVLNQ